jgi:signal transduction histidine kinase
LEKTSLSSIQKKYIDKIKYSAQLLLNNINDLLDYSKIEAGKLVLDSAPFSLSDSLNNLIDIKRKKAREKRLRLTYKSILILLHPPATGYQITVEEQRTIYLMKKI